MTLKRTLLAAIIILGVLFRIWASQPTWIHWDENYYINIFQNYVDRGELTPYMWRLGGDTNIIAGSGTGYGIFVLIGWLSLVGESLFGMRMLMVLCGLITTGLYYLIAERWWGSREAGVAALVFGLVSTSSFYTLVGRMDAVAILSYSLVLLLHIWAVRQEKNWLHFLVGVAAVLTTEFHILGLMYLGAFAFYYGIRYIQIVRFEKKFILASYPVFFFLGAGLLGVLYIIVHILPDPVAYFIIPSTCDICMGTPLQSLTLFTSKVLFQRPIEFLLIVIIFYSEIKHKRTNQHFFILYVGFFLSLFIINPPAWIQYYYPILPLLAIGLGGFISQTIAEANPKNRELLKNLFLLISLSLLVLNLMYFLADRFPFENAYPIPETPETEYIQDHIPETEVVMSSVFYYYPLREYRNFLDYRKQIIYGLTLRGEELPDFLNRMNPVVIHLRHTTVENDSLLQQFINERDFVRVTPDLWVTRDLVPQE